MSWILGKGILDTLLQDFSSAVGALLNTEDQARTANEYQRFNDWTSGTPSNFDNAMSAYLQEFGAGIDNEPNGITGMGPLGISNMYKAAAYSSLQSGVAYGSGIAMMLYMTSFAFAFTSSYKISVGDAFTTMNAVYRGAAPLSASDLAKIMPIVPYLDQKTLDLYVAMAGQNLPSTMLSILLAYTTEQKTLFTEFKSHINTLESEITSAVLAVQSELVSLAKTGLRDTFEAQVFAQEVAGSILSSTAERAITAIQKLLVENETVILEYNEGLTTDAEVLAVENENLLEGQATQTSYEELVTSFDTAITNAALPDLNAMIAAWQSATKAYVDQLNQAKASLTTYPTDTLLQPLLTALDDILAYRTYSSGATWIFSNPFTIGISGGTTPPSSNSGSTGPLGETFAISFVGALSAPSTVNPRIDILFVPTFGEGAFGTFGAALIGHIPTTIVLNAILAATFVANARTLITKTLVLAATLTGNTSPNVAETSTLGASFSGSTVVDVNGQIGATFSGSTT